MITKSDLYKFVKLVSNKLGIKKPDISFNFKNNNKNSVFFLSSLHDNKIYIDPIVFETQNGLDIYFALAHECRHFYQHKIILENKNQTWKENIDNYIQSNNHNTTEYNLQPLELDANAWATYFMQINFEVTPLFKGLDNKVKTAIFNETKKFMI